MAVANWTGNTDTDWAVTTNWTGGALPVANDDVTILASASNDLLLNIDRTGDTAGAGLDLDSFTVEEGCPITIGSSTVPLQLIADKISILGGDQVFFQSDSGTSGDDTDLLIMDAPGTYCQLKMTNGPKENHFLGGIVNVAQITNDSPSISIYQGSSIRSAGGAYVELDVSASMAILIYYINAGEMKTTAAYLNNGITRLTNGGGKVTIEGAAPIAVYVQTAGRTNITQSNFSVFVSGWVMGGVLDSSRGWSNADASVSLNLWPSAAWLSTPYQRTKLPENRIGE